MRRLSFRDGDEACEFCGNVEYDISETIITCTRCRATYGRNPEWRMAGATFRILDQPTPTAVGTGSTGNESSEQFLLDLVESFLEEPIQDGYSHPSETILKNALKKTPKGVHVWIDDIWKQEKNAGILASLMKCLGRLSWDEVACFGLNVVQASLRHADIEVRDAAVQAIELWDRPEAFRLLQEHVEEVDWLREYISQIV